MYHIRSTTGSLEKGNLAVVFEARIAANGEHAYGQAYSAFRNAPHGDGDWEVSIILE